MAPLTIQQKRCLDAITALTVDGVGPSYEELRVHLGFSSKSEVSRCVDGLILRRQVRRIPHHARSLQVIEPGVDPYSVAGLERLDGDSLRRVAGRCAAIMKARAS